MTGQDYKVEWEISSISMNYEGSKTVFAYGNEDAEKRAKLLIAKDMIVSESLIKVISINSI